MQQKALGPIGHAIVDAIVKRDGSVPRYKIKPRHIIQSKPQDSIFNNAECRKFKCVWKARPILVREGMGYRRDGRVRKTSVPIPALMG